MIRKIHQKLRGLCSSFRVMTAGLRDTSGSIAIEFALIAPVLILLYTLSAEISLAMEVNRKVSKSNRTITDLVTQHKSLTVEQLKALDDALPALLDPFDYGKFGLVISAIDPTPDDRWEVAWSYKMGGLRSVSARAVGPTDALPDADDIPDKSFVILGESTMDYHSPISLVKQNKVTRMVDRVYMWPRYSKKILCPDC